MQSTNFVFSIPLAWEAHDLAQCNRQRTSADRAKQVYLRTLAAYAVKYYLDCMGIEATYGDGVCQPALFELSHAAELEITDLGRIECLPVLPESAMVEVSPEVWSDRIAYIAVQLDQSLQTATLVGFVKTVATEQILLKRFQQNSIEDLLFYFDQLRQTIPPLPIKLSQWFHNEFHNEFQQGWQNLNALLTPQEFAYRNRRVSSAMGQKILDLQQTPDEKVELCLGLTPIDASELNVWVGVYPMNDRAHLPVDLQLAIVNEADEAVMQAQAKSTENIQLEFTGEPGEAFRVCLTLGDVSITEAFVI